MSAATEGGLAGRYVRTEAGRAEIRRRALPLSRPARNLLLIVDASRSGQDWLALVQGCVPDELQALLDAGLLAPAGAAEAALPLGRPTAKAATAADKPAARADAAPRMSLAEALQTKDHRVLCRRMMIEARPRLGMVKGYWLALEVDHSESPADVRALALRFVEQVREVQGDAGALALVQALLAKD